MQKISVDLWFDNNAEEAVAFYTSVFNDARVLSVSHYGKDMPGPEGSVMYIEFLLEGQRFGAVNGGPHFKFNPAISLVVACEDQAELDQLWSTLSAVPEAEQCGWLQDKFGLSWQLIPKRFYEVMAGDAAGAKERAMQAVLNMKKLDLAAIEAAIAGA